MKPREWFYRPQQSRNGVEWLFEVMMAGVISAFSLGVVAAALIGLVRAPLAILIPAMIFAGILTLGSLAINLFRRLNGKGGQE